ncbi:MAG TPA: response regulator [Nitrospiria bacterium]|jgi:CheY-like chemotaxis protein
MDLRRKLILVADDDENFVIFISTVLKRLGFDIVAAKDGMEVLSLLKIITPHIILLDLRMPKVDGVTALKYLKEDGGTSEIPVVMVTAYSDEATLEECRLLGCKEILKKPVKIITLDRILQDCITYGGGKRRKFLRTPLEKKVTVSYKDITRDHYAVSLSEGGVYIRQSESPPVGTEVKLVLPVKGNNPLFLKGKVIYNRSVYKDILKASPGMAVEFNDLTPNDLLLLREYILKLLSDDIIEEQTEFFIATEQENSSY